MLQRIMGIEIFSKKALLSIKNQIQKNAQIFRSNKIMNSIQKTEIKKTQNESSN